MHEETHELDQEQETEAIETTIKKAGKYKLIGDVMYASMKHMQENPGSSISEALYFGEREYNL